MKLPINIYRPFLFVLTVLFMATCATEEPQKEETPELITKATLTFTPTGGGAQVVVTATDPDGEGVQNITVDGPINLPPNTTFTLAIELLNGLVDVGQPGYDITAEVEEEGQEHQFFFGWTNDVFANPSGNGNLDKGSDPVDYSGAANSKDIGGLNLGITTTWTSAASTLSGTFRVVLKHQPGTKTPVSDATVGETDLDLTFTINVQ